MGGFLKCVVPTVTPVTRRLSVCRQKPPTLQANYGGGVDADILRLLDFYSSGKGCECARFSKLAPTTSTD